VDKKGTYQKNKDEARTMMPVFVGGCGRSGTTLLGAILGTHSECICTPESQFKTDLYHFLSQSDNPDFMDVLNRITKLRRFRFWGFDIDKQSFPSKKISTYSELIFWIVKKYAEKTGKRNPGIWIDHTPANIRHTGILFELFPDARLIHLVRDGRAVAASMIPLDWGPNTIDHAAHFWMKKILLGLEAEKKWQEKVIRVKYEDLVHDPEKMLKHICSYLNIDFQSEMIKGTDFRVPLYSSEQHALIGKEPDIRRVNAWENTLKPRQIEIFESISGQILVTLGYSLHYGVNARKMTGTEKTKSLLYELYKKNLINKFVHWLRIKRGLVRQ
jgi:hypothetical protein